MVLILIIGLKQLILNIRRNGRTQTQRMNLSARKIHGLAWKNIGGSPRRQLTLCANVVFFAQVQPVAGL
jgi:hypothetical protein